MLEGYAIEILHHDEGLAILLVDLVNGADVGMVEGGGGLGFTAEAAQNLRVFRDLVRQELQGDEAVELGVDGFVDDAHASAAQSFDDAIVRDGLADHWGIVRGYSYLKEGMGKRQTASIQNAFAQISDFVRARYLRLCLRAGSSLPEKAPALGMAPESVEPQESKQRNN